MTFGVPAIEITNKTIYTFIAGVVIYALIAVAGAYGGNNPGDMGHTLSELEPGTFATGNYIFDSLSTVDVQGSMDVNDLESDTIGVGDPSPDALVDIASTVTGDIFRVDDNGDGDTSPFIIRDDGNVDIGATSRPASFSDYKVYINGKLHSANTVEMFTSGAGNNWAKLTRSTPVGTYRAIYNLYLAGWVYHEASVWGRIVLNDDYTQSDYMSVGSRWWRTSSTVESPDGQGMAFARFENCASKKSYFTAEVIINSCPDWFGSCETTSNSRWTVRCDGSTQLHTGMTAGLWKKDPVEGASYAIRNITLDIDGTAMFDKIQHYYTVGPSSYD